jgi:exopolysaccharide production protein ExoY
MKNDPDLNTFDRLGVFDNRPIRRRSGLMRFAEDSVKRDIDVIGALCFMILCAPIFLLVSLAVKLDGGPVFFVHKRMGRGGFSFGCYKFRTMMVGAEECLSGYFAYNPEAVAEWRLEHKLRLDPRVTPMGAILRKTSVDEIPQMLNVLLGHMSLVGPRPVTEAEMTERYGPHAKIVMSVRPGVTGPWQVRGRNGIGYTNRIQLDAEYVRSRSLISDIGILLQTIPVVLGRVGAR